jgi:hypothetical protein
MLNTLITEEIHTIYRRQNVPSIYSGQMFTHYLQETKKAATFSGDKDGCTIH